MSRPRKVLILSVGAALIAVLPLFAGGPNNLNGKGGYFTWAPGQAVPFTIDLGPLGPLANGDAADLVREATDAWNNVESATVEFRDNGFLAQDLTVNNYAAFFGLDPGQEWQTRPENPVVFDTDGKIIDDYLGKGSGTGGTTLGFAGIRDVEGDYFFSAWVVLNGAAVKTTQLLEFRETVTHELGHLLGLDHSQGYIENYDSKYTYGLNVPLMFPIGGFEPSPDGPIQDDIAWLSWIYPSAGFKQETGTIRGKVYRLRIGGPPFQGANVVAIPALPDGNGGFVESRANITSVVSDFLARGTGEYELPGLPAGDYFIRIDPLRSSFTGGSGVGPFDERPRNFPKDFFDENESATDDPTAKTVIHVSAGEVVGGIDMVANELAGVGYIRLSADGATTPVTLGDDDSKLIIFPSSFVFPFFNKSYHEVYINSDGSLTFGVGDAKPGEPRTEERFLADPPRIAPLFTDLDPSLYAPSRVEVSANPGSVRFIWNGVPEFSEVSIGGPNVFSVTLYSTGKVAFDYTSVYLTPDDDLTYSEGLLAIVGVSPGGGTTGSKVDFTSSLQNQMNKTAIYQVFTGSGPSFDLTGETVEFDTSLTDLWFPLLRGDQQNFSGYAITNYGSDPTVMTFEARADDGSLQPYASNPSSAEIPADSQFASLGREIFGVPAASVREGWVRMQASRPEIASFFQYGNGLTGSLTRMDGSNAFSTQATKLYFNRIYDGAKVFPSYSGQLDAVTRLAVANPNATAITATFRIFNNFGIQLGAPVVRDIPAWGRLYERASTLMGINSPLNDGFIEVIIDGPGAVGFELIELPDTLLGLNASFDNPNLTLYSAQLGHGQDIFTSLKLTNTTTEAKILTVSAFLVQATGSIDTRVKQFTLGARQCLQQNVDSIFGLPTGGSQAVVGSILVESTGAGVIGDVVFGDPSSAKFAAALPLQRTTFRKAVHSQISNGTVPGSAALSYFTGLAIFNPDSRFASDVTIEVFDRDGLKIGEAAVELKAHGRISNTLVELVPESAGLVRGYIIVTATRPVVAQQLFGNLALDYLSAVIPVVLE